MLSQLHIQFTLFLFLFHIVSFLLDTRVPAVLTCYWCYTKSSVGSHMEDMMEKRCLQGLDTTFHFIICKSTYLLVSVIKSFNSIFYFWHKSFSLFDWNLIASFPIHFSSLPTSFSTFTFSTFLHFYIHFLMYMTSWNLIMFTHLINAFVYVLLVQK